MMCSSRGDSPPTNCEGRGTAARAILRIASAGLSVSMNGRRVHSSHSTTPSANWSLLPATGSLRTCSGDM
ncbi:hypothetical protein COSO111634_38205 [Corallococcus soli]